MGSRLDLQTILEGIVGADQVYFQPRTNTKIDYSSGVIVYHRDWATTQFAENLPYRHTLRYQVMYIDPKQNYEVLAAIAALPMCVYDRFFTADDLNHDVFKLFF